MVICPQVMGAVIVEYSIDNSTWENVTNVNENTNLAYVDNLEEGILYYFRSHNDTSEWTYFTQRTQVSGEKGMSSLAVTGFVVLITFGVLGLPFIVKRFSESDILNTSLKGVCYSLGLFLLALVTTMVGTLSNTFSLGVTTEIYRFLWLIQWASYLSMVIVVLGFGYRVLQLWQMKKQNRRYGIDNGDEV